MKKGPSFTNKNNTNKNETKMVEKILTRIMTTKEYSRIKHPETYIFKLKIGNKEIFYFDSSHIFDPENPLFSEIEAKFKETNPDLVLVEGIDMNKFNVSNEIIRPHIHKLQKLWERLVYFKTRC